MQGGGSTLADGSEGFLEDCGQPPKLVSGSRVVADIAVELGNVVFPSPDEGNEFFADFAACGTSGEEVFRAVDFRGLSEDGGAALGD